MTTNNTIANSAVTESTEFKLIQVTREELLATRFLPYMKSDFSKISPDKCIELLLKYFKVIDTNNLVTGCIIYHYVPEYKYLFISLFERVSTANGKCYGSKMFAALENHINEIQLVMRVGQAPKVKAIVLRCKKEVSKFWKNQGFEPAEDFCDDTIEAIKEGYSFFSKKFEYKPLIKNFIV